MVQLIFLIAYFRTFSIGNEFLFKEANENNKNQENILIPPLIINFSAFIFAFIISGYYLVKLFKINYYRLFKAEMQEFYVDLLNSILLGFRFTFDGL